MSTIERLAAFRHQTLRYFLVGFVVWMGANILREFIPRSPVSMAILAIGMLGWGIWMVGVWNMFRLQKAFQQNRQAALALNDERVQADRAQAAFTAMAALCILNGVLIALTTFYPTLLSGSLVAQLNILTVSAVFIGAFLRRDSENLAEGGPNG